MCVLCSDDIRRASNGRRESTRLGIYSYRLLLAWPQYQVYVGRVKVSEALLHHNGLAPTLLHNIVPVEKSISRCVNDGYAGGTCIRSGLAG